MIVFASFSVVLSMNNNRIFSVLSWNVRGLNSKEKWDAIRAKINESSCHIVCLQETKRDNFDPLYLKNFCPKLLSSFVFFPSVGASGRILTVWNSNMFSGEVIQANAFGVTVKFTNKLDNNCFFLSNIYGPSHAAGNLLL